MHSPDTAFREFRATLQRFVARRLRNPEDVEDVVQDVFLRVTRNRVALENAKEPLAWLFQVTKTALIDHTRRQQKHGNTENGVEIDDLPDLSTVAQGSDFAPCLEPLVAQLPPKYRDAIRYVDLEGGRQIDLAKANGVTGPTARSQVQRGRQMLKSAILACCRVEKDALKRITALEPEKTGPNCC